MIDLSIIIPTHRRRDSLAVTLKDLAGAHRHGLVVEVVVVENDVENHSETIVDDFRARLELRYYLEPRPGKHFALNRALDEGVGGRMIAVLDDDMSVAPNWLRGVMAITQRWPQKGYYTGRSLIRWPDGPVPDWCQFGNLSGWAYSVLNGSLVDQEISSGLWASGNCFWFRSAVLADGRRFSNPAGMDLATHMDMHEPLFMLQLAEESLGGVVAPDAVAWHRIQRDLLDVQNIKKRAARCGRGFAEVRLRPFRESVPIARLFQRHSLFARIYCRWHWLKESGVCLLAKWLPLPGISLGRQLHGEFLIAYYRELLRIASQMSEYHVEFRLRTSTK